MQTRGFTLVELIIVMAVTGILAVYVFINIGEQQARSRDTERTSDIDTLHSRLEEYFTDNGGYPNTFTVATFPSIDPAALIDPSGTSITIATPASDQAAARAVAAPTNSGAQYKYIPYPTGCGAITCTGYVLKTYIEEPTAKLSNPYASYGLNNN